MDVRLPEAVRSRAILLGAHNWVHELPGLVGELARDWRLRSIGDPFPDATEAYAAGVVCEDGTPAVLKVIVPRGDNATHEILTLRLAGGVGSVGLLRDDADRGALLLERLGPSMHDLSMPTRERETHLVRALEQLWRPVDAPSLPTSADKGIALVHGIEMNWRATDRSTPEYVVQAAQQAARNRAATYDAQHAVLLHGDGHQWNAVHSDRGFVLIDPDGLVGEREYDLAVLVREDPLDPAAEPREQAERLARRTGTDADAIWEWAVAQRVHTGLLLLALGITDEGRQMLQVAQLVADQPTAG